MLRLPLPEKLEQLAANTQIMSQELKQPVSFAFNYEQKIMAAKLLSQPIPKAIILKSRQIGTSTFFCFLDVVIALINPAIKVAIVVDTQTKATELLERCKSFARGLGLNLPVENTRKLQLPNGSEIHAITATGGAEGSESKAGRSQSFQLLHLSELPYWPNQAAYASLLATSSGAPVFIESTAKGTGDLFWKLWITPNDYQKVFFSVEDHQSYQSPADSITAEQWTEAQSLGFTSRTHAAYWFQLLANKGNDLVKHLHDYPIKPEHSFLTFEGRWINRDPLVVNASSINDIQIFQSAEKHHRYIAGVDTSGGVGRDGNSIAVLDRTTRKLVAFWKDNAADIDTVGERLQELSKLFTIDVFVIETNGIGQATNQKAKRLGLPIKELTTTEASRYASLLASKQAIESGLIYGPAELAEECASLHLDSRGRFKGKKDSLMAIGFALVELKDNMHIIPPLVNKEQVYIPPELNQNKNWF
jgi:hypothetical protein